MVPGEAQSARTRGWSAKQNPWRSSEPASATWVSQAEQMASRASRGCCRITTRVRGASVGSWAQTQKSSGRRQRRHTVRTAAAQRWTRKTPAASRATPASRPGVTSRVARPSTPAPSSSRAETSWPARMTASEVATPSRGVSTTVA